MTKEEFYAIFERLTGIKAEDSLVYNDEPRFDSVAMVSLIAEVDDKGFIVDIVDILDSENLLALYQTVAPAA
ncbi:MULTISPECIES: hypothetical protein [unclassified Anaerobiospirillum]|uniref:hypothetical protein n=1 Tax=unclassified Anaerobiospirillum TaxID=2647410 RepID=UPI001FF62B20|nr:MULTISPECIES: hypothetical protein [unclassified Anaerobiospirillum]MCK0534745.1 hypothetical protein [Anaerobiospirillum sp. NML120511]MCK0540009.1 hypothetical protein [Anaerobiospirillum sp. NML02-A-032]